MAASPEAAASGENKAEGLRRECRVLARYLGCEASPQVVDAYLRFHARRDLPTDRFDQSCLWLAGRGSFGVRLADAYATRLRPSGALRAKLVLAMALLECDPRGVRIFQEGRARGPLGFFFNLGGRAALHLLLLLAAFPILGPCHLLQRGKEPS